jgi:hypothetical protein
VALWYCNFAEMRLLVSCAVVDEVVVGSARFLVALLVVA